MQFRNFLSQGSALTVLLIQALMCSCSMPGDGPRTDPAEATKSKPKHISNDSLIEVVYGEGTSREAAMHQAAINSIQEAFGFYLEGDSVLVNGELREEVKTSTDGYIDQIECLDEQVQDGIHRVHVRALVRSDSFNDALHATKVSSGKIDGESLGAALDTQVQRELEFKKRYVRALESYSSGILLSSVGDVKILNKEQVVLGIPVTISINDDVYVQLQQRLTSMFKQLGYQPVTLGQYEEKSGGYTDITLLGDPNSTLWIIGTERGRHTVRSYQLPRELFQWIRNVHNSSSVSSNINSVCPPLVSAAVVDKDGVMIAQSDPTAVKDGTAFVEENIPGISYNKVVDGFILGASTNSVNFTKSAKMVIPLNVNPADVHRITKAVCLVSPRAKTLMGDR